MGAEVETNRLHYFVTVVSEGSFTRAAKALYISQPGLSQQVQKLEQELGFTLIDRAVRPWQLTPIGRAVFEQARGILNGVHALETIRSEAQAGDVGQLKVGIPTTALYGAMAPWLRQYQRAHPRLAVSVEIFDTTTLIELLHDDRIDVGVLLSEYSDDVLECHKLSAHEMLVALPVDHVLAERQSVRLRDLRGDTFCMTSRSTASVNRDQIIAACIGAGFSPQVADATGTYAAQVGLVASGVGVAIVPQELRELQEGNVVFRPLDGSNIRVTTALTWRSDNTNPACAAFIKETVSSIGEPSEVSGSCGSAAREG